MKATLDRFMKSLKSLKPELSLRRTKNITVAEILDKFAPPREGATGVDLVSLGGEGYFLVIQGPDAQRITNCLLDYVDAMHRAQGK